MITRVYLAPFRQVPAVKICTPDWVTAAIGRTRIHPLPCGCGDLYCKRTTEREARR